MTTAPIAVGRHGSCQPRRNDRCPCGSGFKFKKCCLLAGPPSGTGEGCASTAFEDDNGGGGCGPVSAMDGAPSLPPRGGGDRFRFRVGDQVEAYLNDRDGYVTGTVVALNYWEEGFLSSVPYQIALDGGGPRPGLLIYAPFDDDGCVRAIPGGQGRRRDRRFVPGKRGRGTSVMWPATAGEVW